MSNIDLSVAAGGLKLKNPVLTASGTFGYGLEFMPFFDIGRLGGFCTKGLSLEPMAGNQPGRIAETPAGMLNAIGLENVGTEAFIAEKLPRLHGIGCHVIANILGKSVEEFVSIAERLSGCEGVSALELNISCPNIKEGGVEFGHDPVMTHQVTRAVREVTSLPVWVKLSPNVTDVTVFARACEEGGADGVSLVNTFVGMSIDVARRRPMLSNLTGGLSGPAIRPLAVRMVHQIVSTCSIPVIGIGGIATARDALEFLLAGACAVQIGTANFYEPTAAVKVIDGLTEYCRGAGITSIDEIIGALELPSEGTFYYY